MNKDLRIIIAGAGIGGLTAAACMLKSGFRNVRIYEQASVLAEIGAGIQSSANAVKVLYHLGLREALEETVVRPKEFQFRRFDTGETMYRIPLGETHERINGAPYFHIHRADLHELLAKTVLDMAPDCITLKARATGFE
jgi:salicylate hydroxylase